MGQKTNPNLFRLILTEKYLSKWYSKEKQYSKFLKEDYELKKIIINNFEKYFKISNLQLVREESLNKNIITFKLSLLCPKEKDFYFKAYNFFLTQKYKTAKQLAAIFELNDETLLNFSIFAQKLAEFLKKKTLKDLSQFEKNNIYFFKINFIKNPYFDCNLIAKIIADQIEKRTPYRRVIKQIIENFKLLGLKGAIISISGRLNGVEMARTEIKRYGTVPLHTLKAKIDYGQYNIKTAYGIIGLKIWLNQE